MNHRVRIEQAVVGSEVARDRRAAAGQDVGEYRAERLGDLGPLHSSAHNEYRLCRKDLLDNRIAHVAAPRSGRFSGVVKMEAFADRSHEVRVPCVPLRALEP
ncbi:MAG: hypothetical protein ACREUG_13450 [Steroidobacteraceae bacterium]